MVLSQDFSAFDISIRSTQIRCLARGALTAKPMLAPHTLVADQGPLSSLACPVHRGHPQFGWAPWRGMCLPCGWQVPPMRSVLGAASPVGWANCHPGLHCPWPSCQLNWCSNYPTGRAPANSTTSTPCLPPVLVYSRTQPTQQESWVFCVYDSIDFVVAILFRINRNDFNFAFGVVSRHTIEVIDDCLALNPFRLSLRTK